MNRKSGWLGGIGHRSVSGGRDKSSRRKPANLPRFETLEDRTVFAAGVTASYAVTQNWGSGFQAQVELQNQAAANVPNWKLSFNYAASITDIWDATIISHTGSQYVIGNAGWNSTLAAGGNVGFGFNAAPASGGTAAPTGYLLNGVALGQTPVSLPTLTVADAAATEQGGKNTNEVFAVTLSAASSSPVTVQYSTADGTAHAGTDYTAASGTLTLAPGQTFANLTVPVLGNTTAGPDKTFSLSLASPSGATLSRTQATGTIHDGNPATISPVASFKVTDDWDSGFTGQITVTNTTSQTITDWQLAFNFAGTISSIWNASVASQTGSHYVVGSAAWNASLAPGASTTFGFNGAPGGGPTPPTGYVLSAAGQAPITPPSTPNQPPVATNETFTVVASQANTLSVLSGASDPSGNALTLSAVSAAAHGTVTINSNNTATYTPTAGFTGTDGFTYTVSDGQGGTASAKVTLDVVAALPATQWPTQFFAPYVDMTLYPTYNLASAMQTGGVKYFTLAFITADANNQSAWGGYTQYEVNGGQFDLALRAEVATVRAAGGDVMASFGGEAGTELAEAITNVAQLTAAYQTVVTDYGLTHLDFDIEGAAVADTASIDRRSQALAALEQTAAAAGHPLSIWFTLPALPTGLTSDGLYVVQSALKYGVQIAGVNLMTMDFGDGAAPNPAGQMGTYSIEAAQSLFAQLQTLYGTSKTSAQLWGMIGLTPMIGMNDQTDEVFDEAAAQQITTFAQQQGLARISMWSLGRDTQGTAKSYVDSTSSSITQQAFDFSHIFEKI